MVYQNRNNAVECQEIIFKKLIGKAVNTAFGKEHSFEKIKNVVAFASLPLCVNRYSHSGFSIKIRLLYKSAECLKD